jgi:Ca-activated chloride channel family protein
MRSNMTFANPEFLFLLLLLVPILAWYILRHNRTKPSIQVSSIDFLKTVGNTWKVNFRHVIFALRMLALALLIIVLARPQLTNKRKDVTTEGIDIMLTLDISSSMLSLDFKPNRLEAAKDVATEFISGRSSDRIGLVIFSAESFTQCPLTTDHAVLINLFRNIKSGMIEDGTAIGLGLATSVSRLKDSNAKSKVIILLTDGVNNRGAIAPITAAEIAKTFGIRVYTIGVGTMGNAPYPFQTPMGIQYQNIPVEIDEAVLKDIAKMTDGKYFRATDNKTLREIYQEIDKMEKSKIEISEYSKHEEVYLSFALLAGLCLILEILLRFTVFKTVP